MSGASKPSASSSSRYQPLYGPHPKRGAHDSASAEAARRGGPFSVDERILDDFLESTAELERVPVDRLNLGHFRGQSGTVKAALSNLVNSAVSTGALAGPEGWELELILSGDTSEEEIMIVLTPKRTNFVSVCTPRLAAQEFAPFSWENTRFAELKAIVQRAAAHANITLNHAHELARKLCS